jgi:hypothetical protein
LENGGRQNFYCFLCFPHISHVLRHIKRRPLFNQKKAPLAIALGRQHLLCIAQHENTPFFRFFFVFFTNSRPIPRSNTVVPKNGKILPEDILPESNSRIPEC